MSWNPKYALLMALSTVITYLSGLLIDKANKLDDEKKRIFFRRLWVALSFMSILEILFFFKYFHFAINNINIYIPKYNQLIKSENYILSYAEKEQISVIGSFNPETANAHDEDFYDFMHPKREFMASLCQKQ